jgi:hypothetical protein
MNEGNIDDLLEKNDEMLTLKEFREKYTEIQNIYIAGLKKHHLLYFTLCACNDNNNIFLKFSFFSLSINLYFGINTVLIFDSNMSDAYYKKGKAKAGYILMNLLLPFCICGLISFFIKLLVMPRFFMNKILETIKDHITTNPPIEISDSSRKNSDSKRKHTIKNKKANSSKLNINNMNEINDKLSILYCNYLKRVIIYFVIGFVVLAINWYLLTAFCAIYRNTGLKLLLNTAISLLASFVLPFILGIFPTFFGFLAIKKNKQIFYDIYRKLNILL